MVVITLPKRGEVKPIAVLFKLNVFFIIIKDDINTKPDEMIRIINTTDGFIMNRSSTQEVTEIGYLILRRRRD